MMKKSRCLLGEDNDDVEGARASSSSSSRTRSERVTVRWRRCARHECSLPHSAIYARQAQSLHEPGPTRTLDARARFRERPQYQLIPCQYSLHPAPKMLQMLGRGTQRCLARSRLPSSSLCSPSTGRPLAASLRTVRFNSSLSQPPTPPPGFTSELLKPAPSERPQAPPSILDKVVPKWAEKAKPYLHLIRIDKPIGSILLFWPGGELWHDRRPIRCRADRVAWGIMMASTIHHLPPSVPASLTALFAVGAVVMRGAGCTINDMWDEKFDRAVGEWSGLTIVHPDDQSGQDGGHWQPAT
jgi:hypothetical protein